MSDTGFDYDKYKKKTVCYCLVRIFIEPVRKGTEIRWHPLIEVIEDTIPTRKDADYSRILYLKESPSANPQNVMILQYDSVE